MGHSRQGRGSKKKKTLLKQYLADGNPHGEPFLSFLPLVAAEKGLQSREARKTFFAEELARLKSFKVHGPTVKLTRWYRQTNDTKVNYG